MGLNLRSEGVLACQVHDVLQTHVEAPIPASKRMITRPANVGANAVPSVKAVKMTKVAIKTGFLP